MSEIKITSGIIEKISYYDKILYVKLMNGQLLSYNSVPKELFDEFAKTHITSRSASLSVIPR